MELAFQIVELLVLYWRFFHFLESYMAPGRPLVLDKRGDTRIHLRCYGIPPFVSLRLPVNVDFRSEATTRCVGKCLYQSPAPNVSRNCGNHCNRVSGSKAGNEALQALTDDQVRATVKERKRKCSRSKPIAPRSTKTQVKLPGERANPKAAPLPSRLPAPGGLYPVCQFRSGGGGGTVPAFCPQFQGS